MSEIDTHISVKRPIIIGSLALITLVFAIGGWSLSTAITGAVVATGEMRIEGPMRVISHEGGGIVAEALVQNGDPVKAGDTLATLEGSVLQAQLEGVRSRLFETLTAEARWRAQAGEIDTLVIGPKLKEVRAKFPQIETRLARQQSQLDLARRSLASNMTQKARIIGQIEAQIAGKEVQLESLIVQVEIISKELARTKDLLGRQLGRQADLARLERDHAAKKGEIGVTRAEIAERKERAVELEMAMRTLDEDFRVEALQKVSDTEADKAKLVVEHAELMMELRSLSILAPVDGVIHDSQLFGAGSMVVKGKPVVSIVPTNDAVIARVKIRPSDIDQVYVGQIASIRLQAYSVRSTPLVEGKVLRISADTKMDAVSKKAVFEAEIELDLSHLGEGYDVDLVNGMPVTAFLKTEQQSPAEYMIRPIAAFFATSFRDT